LGSFGYPAALKLLGRVCYLFEFHKIREINVSAICAKIFKLRRKKHKREKKKEIKGKVVSHLYGGETDKTHKREKGILVGFTFSIFHQIENKDERKLIMHFYSLNKYYTTMQHVFLFFLVTTCHSLLHKHVFLFSLFYSIFVLYKIIYFPLFMFFKNIKYHC
jgi:hypothetical protein